MTRKLFYLTNKGIIKLLSHLEASTRRGRINKNRNVPLRRRPSRGQSELTAAASRLTRSGSYAHSPAEMHASSHEREPEPSRTVPMVGTTRKGLDTSQVLLRRVFENATVGMVIKEAEDRSWEGNSALRLMLGSEE